MIAGLAMNCCAIKESTGDTHYGTIELVDEDQNAPYSLEGLDLWIEATWPGTTEVIEGAISARRDLEGEVDFVIPDEHAVAEQQKVEFQLKAVTPDAIRKTLSTWVLIRE